jgi:integrase
VRRGIWQPQRPSVTPEPSVEPTFHEFASEWFETHRREWRPRTVEDYEWALTHHLLPHFAQHRLSEISIAEVDRYKAAKLREGKLSPAILNKTLTRLAQVLEVAVEYGHLPANPAKGKRRRVKAQTPRRSWLEPEQVKPLLDAVGRRERGDHWRVDRRTQALLATAVCAGLRIAELLALSWRDVDLASGRITVRDSKTDAGLRVVDVWPELRDVLLDHKARSARTGAADYVFGTSSGKADTRSNISKRLRRAVARANAALEPTEVAAIADGLTPHSLRRTFCSLLYLRGEDPVYVMEQMGHTDPKLALRIYAKVIGDRRRRGAGMRLVGVLDGTEWAQTGTNGPDVPAALPAGMIA